MSFENKQLFRNRIYKVSEKYFFSQFEEQDIIESEIIINYNRNNYKLEFESPRVYDIHSIVAFNNYSRFTFEDKEEVSIELYQGLKSLLKEWNSNLYDCLELIGVEKIVYTFQPGAIIMNQSEFNTNNSPIARNINSFRIHFLNSQNEVIPFPHIIIIIRLIANFSEKLYNLLLPNIDLLKIETNEIPSISFSSTIIQYIDYLTSIDSLPINRLNIGNENTKRLYNKDKAFPQFNILENFSQLQTFENDIDNEGCVAYLYKDKIITFYLIIYDSTIFTLDLIDIREGMTMTNYINNMNNKEKYLTIINGPFFTNLSLINPVLSPANKYIQLGYRKFRRNTENGMPKKLGKSNDWAGRMPIPLDEDLPAKIIIDNNKKIHISSGYLKDDNSTSIDNINSESVLCAFDGLTHAYSKIEGINSPINSQSPNHNNFDAKANGTTNNSMPFIGKIEKSINGLQKEYFFIAQSPESTFDSFNPFHVSVVKRMDKMYDLFSSLDAKNVIYTDGSSSTFLKHKNKSIAPCFDNKDKNKDMPAVIGVIKIINLDD